MDRNTPNRVAKILPPGQMNVVMGRYLLILVMVLFFSSCNSVSSTDDGVLNGTFSGGNEEWLIPAEEVFIGAAKDQILSIDEPEFVKKEAIDFMNPDDLVLALKFGDEVRAYPHKVLNYHEVVNDEFQNRSVSITFCPLTGSGISWSRELGEKSTTFGVSGKIYKNNLIAYDRETDSYWSQMLLQSVHGPRKEQRPSEVFHHMVEMSWEAWSAAFPDSKVLKGTSLLNHAYKSYPYGEDYPTNNESILFPIGNEDDRLQKKTLGHGINYKTATLIFPVETLKGEHRVINHNYKGGEVVVAGDADLQLAVSFSRNLNGELLEFRQSSEPLPAVMEDQKGNTWDVFGEAISGPDAGARLERLRSFNAYWFAWADFYPEAEIYTP